jgi:hypothetical protein
MTAQTLDTTKIVNRKISAASSSLTKLVFVFDDGEGVELLAQGSPPSIVASIRSADQLQEQTEAVCQVDWSWVVASNIESVTTKPSTVVFHLKPAGDLTVDARLWQGSAFLSFMPWHPAKK